MTSQEKEKLLAARHQFEIKDPFPELSAWETHEMMRKDLRKKYFYLGAKPKPEITPYKAWRDGFDFAWKLIEKRLEEL